MSILFDTNVLLRWTQPAHESHAVAVESVARLLASGELLHFTPQDIAEFWNVVTRPIANNGLGFATAVALVEVEKDRAGPDAAARHARCTANGSASWCKHAIEPYPEWQAHAGAPPPLAALRYTKQFTKSADKGFEQAFLTRMLFSCLVDADFLETERFYAEAQGAPAERGGHLDLDTLRERLRAYMAQLRAEAGRAVVFEPAEAQPPAALKAFWQAARPVLRRRDDPLTLDAVQQVFEDFTGRRAMQHLTRPASMAARAFYPRSPNERRMAVFRSRPSLPLSA
jgi:hypothetical protein